MSIDVSDLRATIVPKSDQLNSEQLLAGPMTITVSEVRTSTSDEQPVVIHYEGENGRPYKPCKTMRKVLILAWGEDGRKWAGRSMTLFNEPSVRFGGQEVGGIRISHLTDIPKDIQVNLTATRGKKAAHVIKLLASAEADHLRAIKTAPTLDALKAAFEAAFKSTKMAVTREAFTKAKDARKDELQAPAVKTLEQFSEEVMSAESAGAALAILDAAKVALAADQYSALSATYTACWES
jgi:hypothetical protein